MPCTHGGTGHRRPVGTPTAGRHNDRMEFQDLMAGPPPTHLPEDPAAGEIAAGAAAADVVRAHPESPAAWATLAEQALSLPPARRRAKKTARGSSNGKATRR